MYIKNHLRKIINVFFGEEGAETYKKILTEQTVFNSCLRVTKEGLFTGFLDKFGKVKKIQQNELDILFIEFEKISNNNDKIYLIELIHDKIDLINTSLEFIHNGENGRVQQSEQTLRTFKSELEKLRNRVLETRLKDKEYGLFIKYPRGYEG